MSSNSKESTVKVFHFDDNPFELEVVQRSFQSHQRPRYSLKSVFDFSECQKILQKSAKDFDLFLLDIEVDGLAPGAGILLAKEIRKNHVNACIVMRSHASEFQLVSRSLQAGADDYILKNVSGEDLVHRVSHALRLSLLKQGITVDPRISMSPPTHSNSPIKSSIGSSMSKIALRVPKIIDSAVTAVLIKGESGVGKEVVASLFEMTLGEAVPFVKVNCGAISPSLLESELFGHVKGAFTGAISDRKGLIEEAHGGWIFFDEVGTLSTSAQVALLRLLENKELKRVGESRTRKVAVKVLCATNENLDARVLDGSFRGDLLQRLSEVYIDVAPLRERSSEIPELVAHFCKTMEGGPYSVSVPVLNLLASYSWSQGNVRELRNCLRAMTEHHVDRELTLQGIPSQVSKRYQFTPIASQVIESNDKKKEQPSGSNSCVVEIDPAAKDPFEDSCDRVCAMLVEHFMGQKQITSIRQLSSMVGLSRTTMSKRLRQCLEKGYFQSIDKIKVLLES
jgi:DNA-binding NtrC family response regulator